MSTANDEIRLNHVKPFLIHFVGYLIVIFVFQFHFTFSLNPILISFSALLLPLARVDEGRKESDSDHECLA
jgi:hypothetical protein